MHADHYFEIGHDHAVCQDYALSGGNNKFAYALLCDGCSSSPDVDFGARALALAAREALSIVARSTLTFHAFGALAIGKASAMFPIFPNLDPRALDATLLTTWISGERATAYLFGDGVFFHKTPKSLSLVHVRFAPMLDAEGIPRGPGPAYLSYTINDSRREQYLEASTGPKTIFRGLMDGSGTPSHSDESLPQFDPIVVEATVGPGDVVGVISDGIDSYWSGNGEMSWLDVITEFTGFKNYEGVFVNRRMNGWKRTCREKALIHKDDISMAAICV